MGCCLVPVLQFVNIVQVNINNVRAYAGARLYTQAVSAFKDERRMR
jgi:hypothetical protein